MKKIPQEKLFLSGMDARAPQLARERGLGLELTLFSYAPTLEDAAQLAAAREQMQGISRFWLHAPFAELAPCAIDPMVRQVVLTRFRQTLAVAQQLGVTHIVVHGGFQPHVYFPEWYVAQSVEFWKEFLREVPQNMTLALENVMEPSPETLVEIVRQVDDPRLGLCLDVGHANTCVSSLPPFQWLAPMAPWLRHLHVHNNEGQDDLHAALGAGRIPMARLLDEAQRLCPQASYTIETQDCAASLRWLEEEEA